MRLVMEHLSKQFKNRIAVESIDTELREGVYGFLGANGAGKTTLMQMICGIIEPTAGEVKINGENNIQMGERFRDMLGYLPQEFGYTPGFTANDFMLYIASIKGLPPRFAKRKTKELLKLVNLEKDAGRKIRTFSGGMKRRLGIAQALLNDPKILILDEPTNGLDIESSQIVLAVLKNLALHENVGILISSHKLEDIEEICERVLFLENGLLTFQKVGKDSHNCLFEIAFSSATDRDIFITKQEFGDIVQEEGLRITMSGNIQSSELFKFFNEKEN